MSRSGWACSVVAPWLASQQYRLGCCKGRRGRCDDECGVNRPGFPETSSFARRSSATSRLKRRISAFSSREGWHLAERHVADWVPRALPGVYPTHHRFA